MEHSRGISLTTSRDPIRSETDHHLLSYPHPPSPRSNHTTHHCDPASSPIPPTHTYDVRCPLACVRANRTPPHTTHSSSTRATRESHKTNLGRRPRGARPSSRTSRETYGPTRVVAASQGGCGWGWGSRARARRGHGRLKPRVRCPGGEGDRACVRARAPRQSRCPTPASSA